MSYGCGRCREEVAVRDELSHLERARLAAHLETCASCRSFADRWAATLESARAPAPVLGQARKDALLELVSGGCEPPEPPRRPRVPGWRAAAAVLSAAALLLFAIARPRTQVAGPTPAAADATREGSPPLAAPPPLPSPASPGTDVPRSAAAGGARRVQRKVSPAGVEDRARAPLAPSPEVASPAPGALPHPFDAGSLYADAERALAEGRPADAGRILEGLVELAPHTPEAHTARLELGRLYAGALDRPARAVIHLSAFVEREREPSARGAARVILCPLLPAAERSRVCWPGVAALRAR